MYDYNVNLSLLWDVLPVYGAMGLSGGMVNGLNSQKDNLEGSVRCVIVNTITGGAASVAVLILVVNLFEDFDAFVGPKVYLSLWSIAMVSGFMGMRFMNMMSDILSTKLGTINQKVDEITAQNKAAPHLSMGDLAYYMDDYSNALPYYNRALKADPDSQEAKVGKAKCLYKIATEVTAKKDITMLKEALALLDDVIAKNQNNDHAMLHKAATLLAISEDNKPDSLALLEKADSINPAIGRKVQEDTRFKALFLEPKFKELVN